MILLGLILLIAILLFFGSGKGSSGDRKDFFSFFTPEYKRAGIAGEAAATSAIKGVLRDGDHLFTNVAIQYRGRPTELDNVIVNQYGVFIIEVKNYVGQLVGGEEDYEWKKYKTTPGGNTYMKTVKNPIKQVNRQIYLLAHHLDDYGLRVWVRGYVFLLQNNPPVVSDYILADTKAIDRAIHTTDRRRLTPKLVNDIANLLS